MAASPLPHRPERLDFDALLDRYSPRLFAFVHRLAGAEAGRETVEDLAQEAWIAIYHALPTWRGEASITTWMFSIAARVCARRRPRPRLRLVDDESADERPDGHADPVAVALQSELAEVVRAGIDRLPPGQREAVHLRCLEDLSYAEIAAVLDVPIGTVRSRLHHGTARLADLLAPYMEIRNDSH